MVKVAELTEVVHARGATNEPPLEYELNRLRILPNILVMQPKDGENDMTLPKENIF